MSDKEKEVQERYKQELSRYRKQVDKTKANNEKKAA